MKQFNKIIITNLPSFYKINLYNEIARKQNIFVIYTGDSANLRNSDFFKGTMDYPSILLSPNRLLRLLQIVRVLLCNSYDELIIGGWDTLPMWLSAFCSRKKHNAVTIESSYFESTTTGLKGMLKKIFLMRISKVYASGRAQRKIVDSIGFKGDVIITRGVGIFNYISQPSFVEREKVVNFLYVGRLVECKNLYLLVQVFNELSDYHLYIAGFGPLENDLKSISKQNIHYLGMIENKRLSEIYQKMDVFILPSSSEAWGLVVEESLNNGTPVLVSSMVGCAEEIVIEGENGLIFQYDSKNDLIDKIKQISNISLYNKMRLNISKMNFADIERQQVKCYL